MYYMHSLAHKARPAMSLKAIDKTEYTRRVRTHCKTTALKTMVVTALL